MVVCFGAGASSRDRPAADAWFSHEQISEFFVGEPMGWDRLRSLFRIEAIGPGAYAQADPAEAHEAESIKRFGRFLHAHHGLSLILISKYKTTEALTFDGVVLDDVGRFRANFSLKSRLRFSRRATLDLYDHLDDLKAFSDLRKWIRAAAKLTGNTKRRREDNVVLFRFKSLEQRKHLAAYVLFHRIFVTQPSRPAWLLIDFVGELGGSPPLFDPTFKRLSARRASTPIFTLRDGALAIYSGGHRFEPETICVEDLLN